MRNILKSFIIIAAILSISVKSNAQIETSIIEDDQITKMIQNALFTVLKIEKEYIDSGFTNRKINDDFYIWIDHYPAGFEPIQEILDLKLRLKYISIYSLTKKQKKKGVDGIGFSGVRIDGDKIKLYFSSKNVFLKGNQLYMGIDGDGYSFEYEYSCEKKEWILIKMPKK